MNDALYAMDNVIDGFTGGTSLYDATTIENAAQPQPGTAGSSNWLFLAVIALVIYLVIRRR